MIDRKSQLHWFSVNQLSNELTKISNLSNAKVSSESQSVNWDRVYYNKPRSFQRKLDHRNQWVIADKWGFRSNERNGQFLKGWSSTRRKLSNAILIGKKQTGSFGEWKSEKSLPIALFRTSPYRNSDARKKKKNDGSNCQQRSSGKELTKKSLNRTNGRNQASSYGKNRQRIQRNIFANRTSWHIGHIRIATKRSNWSSYHPTAFFKYKTVDSDRDKENSQ